MKRVIILAISMLFSSAILWGQQTIYVIDNVTVENFDGSQLKGKNIIVIDDIITTGKTATAFIDRMVSAGANVKMAFFLAKTKYFKRYND